MFTNMIAHSDGSEEVRRLFYEQVPELASGVVEIKAIARERGRRSKLAVHSNDPTVDPIGTLVGWRGILVKAVVQQLEGEKIDIFRWSESVEELIRHALHPTVVRSITFDAGGQSARITVDSLRSDAYSMDPGDPVGLRLASRLVGWELELVET